MVKLNLGCGNDKKEGYINIDKYVDSDLQIDVINIDKHFEENSVDEILCLGIVEHLSYVDGEKLLRACYKILKLGGIAILNGIPEFEIFCRHFVSYPKKRKQLFEGFYGNQEHEGQFHRAGYTRNDLENLVKSIGFTVVDFKLYNSARVMRFTIKK